MIDSYYIDKEHEFNLVDAVQLNWKNWNLLCTIMNGLISEENPGRSSEVFHNKCGEENPFIALDVPTGMKSSITALHGDWIVRWPDGSYGVFIAKEFYRRFVDGRTIMPPETQLILGQLNVSKSYGNAEEMEIGLDHYIRSLEKGVILAALSVGARPT